eukprot:213899-Prymnesium_polylepis.3
MAAVHLDRADHRKQLNHARSPVDDQRRGHHVEDAREAVRLLVGDDHVKRSRKHRYRRPALDQVSSGQANVEPAAKHLEPARAEH